MGAARERCAVAARGRAARRRRSGRRARADRAAGRLRLGRRRAAQALVRGDDRLRAARRRIHAPSVVGRRVARHLSRRDRQDSASQGARRHRRRAAARVRVRPTGRAGGRRRAGARQLLGLQPARVLRAARAVRGVRRSAPRVPRHGEGAAQGGDRRDPRRRAESHRRGRGRGPGDRAQGPRERRVLSARRRGQDEVPRFHGLRQHRALQRLIRHAFHGRLPHVLGARDARRRVPLRPRERAGARRRRRADRRSADRREHRVRGGARGHAVDRRAMGRGRVLPARQLARLPLGRMERPLPRQPAAVLTRRARARSARSRRGSRAAAISSRRPARRPRTA